MRHPLSCWHAYRVIVGTCVHSYRRHTQKNHNDRVRYTAEEYLQSSKVEEGSDIYVYFLFYAPVKKNSRSLGITLCPTRGVCVHACERQPPCKAAELNKHLQKEREQPGSTVCIHEQLWSGCFCLSSCTSAFFVHTLFLFVCGMCVRKYTVSV